MKRLLRGVVVGSMSVAATMSMSVSAAAVECESSTVDAASDDCSTVVLGATEVKGQGDPGQPAGETAVLGVTQVRGQQLPVTGTDSAVLLASGAGLILVGGALVMRGRRAGASA